MRDQIHIHSVDRHDKNTLHVSFYWHHFEEVDVERAGPIEYITVKYTWSEYGYLDVAQTKSTFDLDTDEAMLVLMTAYEHGVKIKE